MGRLQRFGIKYPFQNESEEKYFVDLNKTYEEKIRSEVLHIIFTPKGQRYRMPDFGTDIIKYIFEPNDEGTWSDIKNEIKTQITKYLPDVDFQDIVLTQNTENENETYAEITYSVKKGNSSTKNELNIRIA